MRLLVTQFPQQQFNATEDRRTDRGKAWHSQSVEEELAQFASTTDGLSSQEAAQRLAINGRNELKEGKQTRARRTLNAVPLQRLLNGGTKRPQSEPLVVGRKGSRIAVFESAYGNAKRSTGFHADNGAQNPIEFSRKFAFSAFSTFSAITKGSGIWNLRCSSPVALAKLPIIAYCVVQQGGHFLKAHPEWEMRGADGKPIGRFCSNSGYLEAMKAIVAEQLAYRVRLTPAF